MTAVSHSSIQASMLPRQGKEGISSKHSFEGQSLLLLNRLLFSLKGLL